MKEAIRAASQPGPALPFLTRLTSDGTPSPEAPPREKSGAPPSLSHGVAVPTHVLCDGVAYAITSSPLTLGLRPEGANGIELGTSSEKAAGVSRSHCTIYARNGNVVVEDHSRYGTFLNDQRVEGKATLAVGDRLRLGTPGIELRLIQVVSSNGKTTD